VALQSPFRVGEKPRTAGSRRHDDRASTSQHTRRYPSETNGSDGVIKYVFERLFNQYLVFSVGGFKIELQQSIIWSDNPVLSVRRQG
jgi:hypothetical protein